MTHKQKTRRTGMVVFGIALISIPVLVLAYYFYDNYEIPALAKLFHSDAQMSELESMQQMWDSHPGHSPIALALGNLYFEDGQYENAVTYFREYLKADTSANAWEVRLDICRALHQLGRTDEAKAQLDTMLMIDPYNPGALYNYGAIEANEGHYDQARLRWNILVQNHPNDSLGVFAAQSLKMIDGMKPHP